MRINTNNRINFKRRLKPNEEAEYSHTLKEGFRKAGNGEGKRVLIMPASSLPNHTGVGNIGTKESLEFFDLAKKYWGINEIQLLPMGQYHLHNKESVPIYSGTSMDLGNHVINIKDYISETEYQKIIKESGDKVDFANIIELNSNQEKALRNLLKEGKYNTEFEQFKSKNKDRLESKALYRTLRKIYNSHDYKKWQDLDKNLFDTSLVSDKLRTKRIEELYKTHGEEIDFYYFKQYLAEDSLKRGKQELNNKGIKLSGDMLCGFSYDEVWSNPNAFCKNTTIGWNLPALNLDTPEGEKLFRDKVKFYAERYDNFRVDASWTYINQPLKHDGFTERKYYNDKFLNILDEEVQKVKGVNYDLQNITHEFIAGSNDFNMFDGKDLKSYIKSRTQILTSDYLSENWGNAKNFLDRGWNPNCFIIGATNHDSLEIKVSDEQVRALSDILKIPQEKLQNQKEFIKAKFAEPLSAKNHMIFFSNALNIPGQYSNTGNPRKNYKMCISKDYKDKYFKSLENGEGYNPMDALEKNFKAKGLDKTNKKLYKNIVKYRKILEGKEGKNSYLIKIGLGLLGTCLLLFCGFEYYFKNSKKEK